jgi:ankyrin repeat protein
MGLWWLACFGRVEGRTLLMQGALLGHRRTVDVLLGIGADPDAVDHGPRTEGLTALAHAVRGGHVDVVHTLLEAGADPNAGGVVRKDGPRKMDVWLPETRRPLCMAAESGATAIVDLLLAHGAVVTTSDAPMSCVRALEAVQRSRQQSN